jgi:phosphoribosylamine--glycine ligase
MGTITDAKLLTAAQIEKIVETIVKPTLKGAEKEGFPFRGILFLGLMLTDKGIKLLEYNVRFGDPETQVILVKLKTDLVNICNAILEQNLSELKIDWLEGSSACVVLAAENYPAKPRVGDVINGLEKARSIRNISVFHAGTQKNENGDFITSGGRVLGITARGENLPETLEKAYQAVGEISWNGMQFRRDIGKL